MTDFICAVIIPALCTVLTIYIIPFLKQKNLYCYVKTAVQAAEQIYRESGMGKEKFEYVKNRITKKFRISEQDITRIIESAVYELNN